MKDGLELGKVVWGSHGFFRPFKFLVKKMKIFV